MRLWQWFIMFLALIGTAIGFWFLGKSMSNELEQDINDVKTEDPDMGDDLAKTEGAKRTSSRNVTTVQQLEDNYMIEYLAQKLRDKEAEVAQLESDAIINPSPITDQAASEAEAEAEKARAELETQWKAAAAEAESKIVSTDEAAKVAVSSAESLLARLKSAANLLATALKSVNSIREIVDSYTPMFIMGNQMYSSSNGMITKTEYERIVANLRNAEQNYENMKTKHVEDMKEYMTAVSNATTCIANYNFVIERALSIAADLRLLQLLNTTAARLDNIAKAARLKFQSYEDRINNLK